MNPVSSSQPQPVVSLPLGLLVIGGLLLVGGAILLGLLVRRRRAPFSKPQAVTQIFWLRSLLESLPQATLVTDHRGCPVAWNAPVGQSLRSEGEELNLPAAISEQVGRVLETGTAETIDITLSNSPEHCLWVTASPLAGWGALVLIQNPGDPARRAPSYRRLVGAVAHELRTPLTAILGHADILESCHPTDEEDLWRRSLRFIVREAQRLSRLVEDLLTLSRLDSMPVRCQAVNLQAVVEESISALFPMAEARDVQLVLHSTAHLPRVSGDRDRLGEVFVNLLDNAVKYTPPGGKAGVRLVGGGGRVKVEVFDSGVGIPPQDLPFVFDSLYRGDAVQDTPGTGLGLTIVHTILEQHGVSIDVQSTPGQGTTFSFHLPYA